jgi:hypothetical protein
VQAIGGLDARRVRSDYEPEWPIVTNFVDEHWDETERASVASHLQAGLVTWSRSPAARLWAQRGISLCRFCGAWNGSAERTDGVYLWPDGLAHYVREHGVRPPGSVIRHILASQASGQPEPNEDKALSKKLYDEECANEHHVLSREWFTARVNRVWWKTATLDS